MSTLTVTLVLNNGAVDQDASRVAFETALSNYIVQHETQQSTVQEAVLALFAAHPGTAIKMPIIASMTCARLNAQPENHAALSEVILAFVRSNSSNDRADGKLFKIAKGVGGGARLWSDIPVEAPAAPTPAAQ